jgi:hypothetical protein
MFKQRQEPQPGKGKGECAQLGGHSIREQPGCRCGHEGNAEASCVSRRWWLKEGLKQKGTPGKNHGEACKCQQGRGIRPKRYEGEKKSTRKEFQ